MRPPPAAGIRSICVQLPSLLRTNAYFRDRFPETVRVAEQRSLARVFNDRDSTPTSADFDAEMAPYVRDPFRGTVERRVLAPGETALTLELAAAREAIDRAALRPSDVDLLLVGAFPGDGVGVGDAAYLAQELGLEGNAWNLESACSAGLQALEVATALVKSGAYRNVLVVIACAYSRYTDDTDTLSWFLGDGAGAFVVGAQPAAFGVLGVKALNTSATCGSFLFTQECDPSGDPRIVIRAGKSVSTLRDTSGPVVQACCRGAAAAAGVSLEEIACFTTNTPVAWYQRFFARALGVDPERVIDTYPRYANIGPALMPVNLHAAAAAGRLRPGDLVMTYTVGSVSSAGAAVMRWGDVAVGSSPSPSTGMPVQR